MTVWPALRRDCIVLLCCLGWTGCYQVAETNSDEQKDPHFQTGRSRRNSLDYQRASEAFEKALAANPRSASAHFELGLICYQKIIDHAAAIYHFQKYLAIRPDSPHKDNVLQFITDCKQELAKTVSLGPVTQKVQKDLENLSTENLRLKQQVELLNGALYTATNRPPAVLSPAVSSTPTTALVTARKTLPAQNPGPASATNRIAPPAAATKTHSVKAGETPFAITRQYGIKLAKLMAANPGLDPKRMKVGQTIKIPAP